MQLMFEHFGMLPSDFLKLKDEEHTVLFAMFEHMFETRAEKVKDSKAMAVINI